jgi:asparagine synthase (glutamine-hydrolysing)
MCGIYGIFRLDGVPVELTDIALMGPAMVHRGPDDHGAHVDGPCAIGMRRLSIIDVTGGHQPMSSESGHVWLVCNGEIYNFRELRRELETRGHRFRSHSDSEVVLHAYLEYGNNFVDHLNGMFAFALWDSTRGRLMVGRDRLGIKPLYIVNDGKRLAFASEAKALLELCDVDRELDTGSVASYLQLGYIPAPQSIFRKIRKLPPATLLIAENGGVEHHRYWRVPMDVDRDVSEKVWIERIRGAMERSVRMQMVSDVPLGALLSGGIDSSAVVAFMARASHEPVKTYAIGFEGTAADEYYNELPHARRVAELFGTDHREILVKPDVVTLLPRLLWHMDEPIADTAFITTFLVSEFARRDVTVILSGVGGDELFGGYRRYLGSHYQAHFKRLPGWVRSGAVALAERLPSDRHSAVLNMMRLAKGFLSSAELSFEARYAAYVQVFSADATEQLLRINGCRREDVIASAFRVALSDDPLNRMMVVDAETQLPDDLLLLTDKMSMATSLECRVPLLDHELVELAARIPERVKIHRGQLKHAMKLALADVLPPEILARKKRGFGTPMGSWLKVSLKPMLDRLLDEGTIRRRGLFDYSAIRNVISNHVQNRVDGTDQLLSLMNLEIWSRLYLDRRSPQDVALELKEALT